MADKTSVAARSAGPGAASDANLETSRLLVEFLHAAYATRRMDLDAEANGGDATDSRAGRHGTESADVSSHAVRAAIHIYQHGERTVGQLATGLGISYGWASRVVEELEKAGYAMRERDTDDRRVVRVRLNPDRTEEVERAYQWRGPTVAAALEPLTAAEREAVRMFLRRLNGLLREEYPAQY
jgi:MarR family transcriptional regulator, organic hydroperoxide resistance regulator